MLSIRLSRTGKKHQPNYRLIVVDKRRDPWGNYLENLGTYNPMAKPKVVAFKVDRVKYWIGVGAQPTPTVRNLLLDQKIISGTKTKVPIGKPKVDTAEKK